MAVLWLVAILSMAVMTALRVISFDMSLASSKIHGSRARHVAEMGIALGCNPAVKRTDPILRQQNEETGEGFEVRLRSEGARFNINAILLQGDEDLMLTILGHWGLDLKEAQPIVDALVDWVDADDDAGLNGAEVADYENAGRVNQPFNRPFYDLSEMRLVRGMDQVEAMKPDWREWFTVWSSGPLDLNEADAELIAVAADCSVEDAEVIPESVRGADQQLDTEDDVRFQNPTAALDLIGITANARPELARRFGVNDSTIRIESTGYAEGAKYQINCIVRNRTGKPALLERTEEIIP